MFYPANDTFLLGSFNEDIMVLKLLDGRLRDEDVEATFNRVECNWEMSAYGTGYISSYVNRKRLTIGSEDNDRVTRLKLVDRSLV